MTLGAGDLIKTGLPNHPEILPLALKLANVAVSRGESGRDEILERLRALAVAPETVRGGDALWPLARKFLDVLHEGYAGREKVAPVPWRLWGNVNIEETCVRQMENACRLPVSVRGALMPDAHAGYGLPIGGVLAVRDAVIPYAVGVDIACRMRLMVLDVPLSHLVSKRERFVAALEKQTRFGVGASFEKGERREHAVMDEDWNICRVTESLKDKAWKQLGTSGGGNHFAEFGELCLEKPDLGLEAGAYLALLSHSGSRGAGAAIATHYSGLAMKLRPRLSDELRHLAWLDMSDGAGREYWTAMQLMGRYASANHALIHEHVLGFLGAGALVCVENHHNFAWEEEHDGQAVIVHRKGATPAGKNVLGIIPGSMGTHGYVVRGRGNAGSLNSCSHGAGRLMSRGAALKAFSRYVLSADLAARGVELLSGGLDEAPAAYKDINAVMAAQADLVDIVAVFKPRLVKMAPDERGGGRRRRVTA
jgi:tRNA-splicing ligase RtcB